MNSDASAIALSLRRLGNASRSTVSHPFEERWSRGRWPKTTDTGENSIELEAALQRRTSVLPSIDFTSDMAPSDEPAGQNSHKMCCVGSMAEFFTSIHRLWHSQATGLEVPTSRERSLAQTQRKHSLSRSTSVRSGLLLCNRCTSSDVRNRPIGSVKIQAYHRRRPGRRDRSHARRRHRFIRPSRGSAIYRPAWRYPITARMTRSVAEFLSHSPARPAASIMPRVIATTSRAEICAFDTPCARSRCSTFSSMRPVKSAVSSASGSNRSA